MNTRAWRDWTILVGVAGAGALGTTGVIVGAQALTRAAAAEGKPPAHVLPTSKTGDLVVGLCDGDTALEVAGVKAGQTMDRARAQTVATTLMDTWRRKNPNATWDAPRLAQAEATKEAVKTKGGDTASTGAKGVPAAKKANVQAGQTYKNFSTRDEEIWKTSTEAFVARGHKVFHDAKELGGTTGISCDMCHPDGSNTHPETYPKYQVQLGRVALLRDMINWCLENPVRGKPLPDGDERMRAMEAYLYAQRKGTALDFGKH